MQSLNAEQLGILLLSLACLIGMARLLGELAKIFHQPTVLGELLAGVLLGPTVFGWLAPEWQAFLFPREGANAIALNGIGSVSIVLFLLVAGMEVDLSIVWRQGLSALKVGAVGTVVPFVVGLAAAYAAPQAFGREANADPWVFALFFATAMAISALPVIIKTLMDLDLYRTDLGMVVVSAAIFNDLIGWTVFALILAQISELGTGLGIAATLVLTLVFATFMLTIGRWLVHRTLPYLQAYTQYPGGVLGFAVTLGLLGAALTEFIGIHAIFGAFLVGIALGDSTHLQERTRVMIDEFISFIFAPLFFASIGLSVNFVQHFDLRLVVIALALACLGKLAGGIWGARWGGFPRREQWAIGLAMNARGAMEIILGTLALQSGIISQRLFVALVIMAIATSALSGPLIRLVLDTRRSWPLYAFLSSKLYIPDLQADSSYDAIRDLSNAIGLQYGLDAERICQVAWEREQLVATGVGHGLALPHARLAEIREPIVAIGISEPGIPFDAPDGQPAHIVFLLVTPLSDPSVQLDLSASIAHAFREPHCLERLLRAKNFTEFLATLRTISSRKRDA